MNQPYIDPELAKAQLKIIETLATQSTVAEIHATIEQSNLPDELKSWLLTSNPDMLETAAQLVKKWQSKNPDHGVGL